jgi:hypothetical protein
MHNIIIVNCRYTYKVLKYNQLNHQQYQLPNATKFISVLFADFRLAQKNGFFQQNTENLLLIFTTSRFDPMIFGL